MPRGPRPQAGAGARPPLLRDPGERRLTEILQRIELKSPGDAGKLIPALEEPFTTKELAKAMRIPLPLAQKAAHCLRALEVFELAGKRGNAPLPRPALVS